MALLRLAYATEFMIALIAVFTLWSQVGGQGHLDIMPWYLKLVLGCGAAFAAVKATAAAVAAKNGWNGRVLRWVGILVALLILCGIATYYVHMYGEDDEQDEEQDAPAALSAVHAEIPRIFHTDPALPCGARTPACSVATHGDAWPRDRMSTPCERVETSLDAAGKSACATSVDRV